jgi:4-aminobutyrate aminotransferase-like enzyme
VVGHIEGRGLVYGIYIVKEKGSKEPDGQRAADIVKRSLKKGLLMFSPIGLGSSMIKISPPLSITREAVDDGVIALEEAIGESGSSGGC